ncbi:MAG: CDP-glucose 4,6-dehydratase [Rhodomicrobiaceae bacterium]
MENLVEKKTFWKDKKVLVTGHTGFKGSWLSLWLQQLGATVIGISLDPPTKPNLYEQACVAKGMISLRADIRDLEPIKEIFSHYQPEILIHLAAQPLVRYSYREPVETYTTNVMGTLHVLESMRNINSIRSAVMITSDKCYNNQEWIWGYRENESMGGHDPYSSSKGAAELLISSYRNSYYNKVDQSNFTAIATARAGNVIGGGDWAEDRLIPDIIRAFKKNELVKIRNPHSIRPWQHVLEPLEGYLELAKQLYKKGAPYAEPWNFGPLEKDAQPVQNIVKIMADLWGDGASWELDQKDHPHEANYLKLDCTKANSQLGWRPKWDLEFALTKIIDWHKAEQQKFDLHELSINQIEAYQTGPLMNE